MTHENTIRFFAMFSGIGHCGSDKHARNAITVNAIHTAFGLKAAHEAVVAAIGGRKGAA